VKTLYYYIILDTLSSVSCKTDVLQNVYGSHITSTSSPCSPKTEELACQFLYRIIKCTVIFLTWFK